VIEIVPSVWTAWRPG